MIARPSYPGGDNGEHKSQHLEVLPRRRSVEVSPSGRCSERKNQAQLGSRERVRRVTSRGPVLLALSSGQETSLGKVWADARYSSGNGRKAGDAPTSSCGGYYSPA